MKYHQYRIAGYPIGSGAVESGINGVVHHRLPQLIVNLAGKAFAFILLRRD
ncbi:MAG: hypothetical protein GY803_29145 [Chloroflexi bacterium]|nr:hypothetical protein [Chloroflexota bacterium]